MAYMDPRKLKAMYDRLGRMEFQKRLTEALDPKTEGHLRPEDFSIRELAEVCYGEGRVRDAQRGHCMLTEEGDGIDHTAFTNITGRIVSSKLMEAYNVVPKVATNLISTETNVRIDVERLPGLQNLGDVAKPVHPGMPYENVGFGEDYQDLPSGQKYGRIVPILKEAIFFDRTGQILQRAAKIGEALAYRKEREIWQVILGITHNYNWVGTAYRTYYPGAAGDPWTNIFSWPLVDWTSVDNAETLFDNMTDPYTGQPIVIGGRTVLVMPPQYMSASRIMGALQVFHATGPIAFTVSPNPLKSYDVVDMGALARQIAGATNDFGNPDEIWLLGNFKKAFTYRENWPIQVLTAPVNSQKEFEQDIVAQYKGTERGVCAVMDPRYVLISSGSCGHSSSGDDQCTPDPWPAYDSLGGDATRTT